MKKLLLLLIAITVMTACNNSNQTNEDSSKKVTITAAGATFPMPFYNMAFKEYTKKTKILLTYGGIGSGGGIRSLKDKVVDFGATDAFLNDEKMKEMPNEIVHIPTCLGAVVIAYNLPDVKGIKLTNELLEGIFMGKITKWNDKNIVANNPDINLPKQNITVVHRSDGSGTTYIFSDFMSKISESWNTEVGKGKSLKWPCGIGAKGNPGVAGTINQTPGTIGYIGSEYAFAQNIPVALLKNKAGNYIEASAESISAAAKGKIPADTRTMLTNSDDPNSYPISGFTWLILYKNQKYNNRSIEQGIETVNFINWLISKEAQDITKIIHYSPLPESTVEQAREILKTVNYGGEILLK